MAKALLPPASFSKLCSSALRARKVQPSSRRYLHPSTTKKYYSYEHPQPPPFPPAQTAILSASLAHVPAHGFTLTALRLGAQDAGYPAVSTNLFPRGAFEIVYFHLVTQRLALGERVQFHNPSAEGGEGKGKNLAVEEKVRILSWERLCANKPIIHRWQKALAIFPSTLAPALQELHLLSSQILHLASSTAVDSTWYTKRLSLSAAYASAELFMTQDSSANFIETERFLERRLEGGRAVETAVGNVGEWAGGTAWGVLNSLRSKGVRI